VNNIDREAIRQVIEEAYIRGIHETQDKELVRGGFHPDFTMFVQQEDRMVKVGLDEWFVRIEELKQQNPELWAASAVSIFHIIDEAGNAAVVKLDVFRGETHFSTDYMLLYKFEAGWKIVSKVFSVPG
jgi:hypothetical protein